MFRNSMVLAASVAAGQSGPAAAMVCEMMADDLVRAGDPCGEREMFLARSEAALRAGRLASRKAWRMPRLNWRGMTAALPFRTRLAA